MCSSSFARLDSGLGSSPQCRLAQAHARAATVLFNKLYAARFKAPPYHFECCATRLMRARFELAHSHDANSCLIRELLLTPIKEAARGSTLSRSDHLCWFAQAREIINFVEKRLTPNLY
jgi:hypothetical protein